jgi:hypothetical protein
MNWHGVRALSIQPTSLHGCDWVWHTRRMNIPAPTNPYKRRRFPSEIISHCLWLYFRFCLSYRHIGGMMVERGIEDLIPR